ncbi:MAG: hypothetical protein Q4D61_02860 [Cardiobacteriaceae bacterium]|nr:hypothetical protein [Cardiobacteriaceae bacterium]
MQQNHANLLRELYTQFAPYRVTYPLNLCQCPSCMTPDEQRAFLAIPLRELPASWLHTYLESVPSGDETAYLHESKHFLPRICELLLQGAELAHLTETTLGKLNLQHPAWLPHERALLETYARTFMSHIYSGNPFPHGSRDHTANYLLMFHWAGLNRTAELTHIWTAHAHTLAALRDYIALLEDLDWETGEICWKKTLYLPEHCPNRDTFTAQLQHWINHPDTRTAFHNRLEQALLQGLEDEDETAIWENWYDWLGEPR